jgi:hypothetical protein
MEPVAYSFDLYFSRDGLQKATVCPANKASDSESFPHHAKSPASGTSISIWQAHRLYGTVLPKGDGPDPTIGWLLSSGPEIQSLNK